MYFYMGLLCETKLENNILIYNAVNEVFGIVDRLQKGLWTTLQKDCVGD